MSDCTDGYMDDCAGRVCKGCGFCPVHAYEANRQGEGRCWDCTEAVPPSEPGYLRKTVMAAIQPWLEKIVSRARCDVEVIADDLSNTPSSIARGELNLILRVRPGSPIAERLGELDGDPD